MSELLKLADLAVRGVWCVFAFIAALEILGVAYDHKIAGEFFVAGGVLIAGRGSYVALESGLRKWGIAWDAPVLRVIIAGLAIAFGAATWNHPWPTGINPPLDFIPIGVIVAGIWVWALCYALHPDMFYEAFTQTLGWLTFAGGFILPLAAILVYRAGKPPVADTLFSMLGLFAMFWAGIGMFVLAAALIVAPLVLVKRARDRDAAA